MVAENVTGPKITLDHGQRYSRLWEQSLHYDFAIYEVEPMFPISQEPKPVPISPTPAPTGEQVFLIGSPNGIPFKYTDGGSVKSPAYDTAQVLLNSTMVPG